MTGNDRMSRMTCKLEASQPLPRYFQRRNHWTSLTSFQVDGEEKDKGNDDEKDGEGKQEEDEKGEAQEKSESRFVYLSSRGQIKTLRCAHI